MMAAMATGGEGGGDGHDQWPASLVQFSTTTGCSIVEVPLIGISGKPLMLSYTIGVGI